MRAAFRSLLLLVFACACPVSAHAVNCALSSGASTSTIQTILNAAGSNSCDVQTVNGISLNGSTVLFQAGNYSITSQLSVPCPNTAMVIEGVAPSGVGTAWPIVPAAILTSNLTDNWAFSGHACNTAVTFQYLQYDGNQPSGGGGGFLYMPAGMNKVTVQWNWFYGNSALQTTSQSADAFIWIDGNYGTHTQNTTIQFNRFGYTGSGDCGGPTGLMTLYGGGGGPGTCSSSGYAPPSGTHTCLYQGSPNLNSGGGYCAAVGIHNDTDNLTIANNSVQEQEQAFKCFENSGGVTSTNTNITKNDLSGIHRIGLESQCNDGQFNVDSNDFHDAYYPNGNQWGLSLPQGSTNSTNNVLIANIASPNDRNGNPGSYSGCGIEFWGNETSSQNLIQGLWCAGIQYGRSSNPNTWSANNNIVQLSAFPGHYIVDEGYGTTPAPAQSGNSTSGTVSALTSVAPTISPTPTGTYSAPITVTLTDNGITSGAGPRGNISIYYTTDGTTPAIGQGTTKFYTGPFSVAQGSTVKALGMWGALNQPASYPSGYGFKPSSVVTAFYPGTGGSTPTLSSITLSCPSTSLTAGASAEQCSLTCNYSDSTHFDCTTAADIYGHGPGVYASSQPLIASISSSAMVTPLTAGATNLTATIGALTSTLPVSVAASGGGGGGPTPFLGNNQENYTGVTFSGCFNSVYSISPPYPTTVGAGHFFLPTDTITSGAHYDLLIISAPTATTEASSPICKGTWTAPSSTSPNAFVNVTMSGCGTIAANTPYWVAGITNDGSGPNYGFWNCGGSSCSGTAPTTYGTGTYPSRYVCGITYGTYTSLPSSLSANSDQVSQYVDLVATAPTIVQCYQGNTPNANTMVAGGGYQQHAYCQYSDGVILQSDTTNTRGDAVSAWSENSGGAVLTIGAVGSGTPGLITGVGYGTASSGCTVDGTVVCAPWVWTVTNQPATGRVIQGATLHNAQVN